MYVPCDIKFYFWQWGKQKLKQQYGQEIEEAQKASQIGDDGKCKALLVPLH